MEKTRSLTVEQRFRKLAGTWKRETAYLSAVAKKAMHPAYQHIIGLGEPAVPFILEELKSDPADWFWALTAITGENPVDASAAGHIDKMAASWLKWLNVLSSARRITVSGVVQSWRTIESVLWENVHSIYRALRKPATDALVARLAKRIPAKLPRDFVQSLKVHAGLSHSHLGQIRLFDYYALLPVSAILAEHKTLCALQSECEFGGNQLGSDPSIRNDAHWRPGWLPIMDADGDKLVIDLDPAPGGTAGQIFEWSNSGSIPLRVRAPSFGAWFAKLAVDFRDRRFRLDEHGAIWLDEGRAAHFGRQ